MSPGLYYIPEDGVPIIEQDPLAWDEWAKNKDRCILTEIGDVEVSTVRLGLDHSLGGDVPMLFETMIFGGEYDDYQERYHTLEEAQVGHEKAVSLVKMEEK